MQTSETPTSRTFEPIRIVQVDLNNPIPKLEAFDPERAKTYHLARCFVRIHQHPIGLLNLKFGDAGLSADEYARCIWSALQNEINAHLRADGLPEAPTLTPAGLGAVTEPKCQKTFQEAKVKGEFASVILPTRDRATLLERCLNTFSTVDYPNYEVIVVDNAPSNAQTYDVVQKVSARLPQIKYTREDRPGISAARNHGISIAQGDIVIFVDDDVIIDPGWIGNMVLGFSAIERVACVTGLIIPYELETEAQEWFEQYGGFNKGYAERIFDMKEHRGDGPLYPYTAGRFGTGGNMAFRKSVLKAMGGFDPLLKSSEDIWSFFQVITDGYRLVYEPSAIVFHQHRRDYAGLHKQISAYGTGLSAFLTKAVIEKPWRIVDLALRLPYGLYFTFSRNSPKNNKKQTDYPAELTLAERKGLLRGWLDYLKLRINPQ
jgi:glycosyltransferase involved in cell wall biosynthesis